MDGREQRIYEEASALWRELHGEPPPMRGHGADLLDALMKALPEKGYERLASPHLRPTQITPPRPGA